MLEDEMTYSDSVFQLLKWFPNMPIADYEEDMDLPYVIYGEALTTYIKKLAVTNDANQLIRVFDFLEEMANCEDEEVQNLLQVGVLEVLWDDRQLYFIAHKYMHQKTADIFKRIGVYFTEPN